MPRRTTLYTFAAVLAASLLLSACADPLEPNPDDEFGMDGPVLPPPEPGKDDSEYRRGLWVNTDTRRTQVWTARNRWEDTDTPAARAAGLAWGENSGLTWDEKYARWVASFQAVPSEAGYYDTFEITTPWGKTLPSPRLECAEMSIFLRISFAAWYELPFFMEAVGNGQRIYFGHNGVRTQQGRHANTPEYAIVYRDHSGLSPAQWQQSWPTDATLRGRGLYGGNDEVPWLGDDARMGAYLDEIHLNKRVGYFTLLSLAYLGSMHLASTANTYNIVPESVRAGDTLLHRWQRSGIGHTLVVKDVTAIGEGNKDITVVSGSMPRRQGRWESGASSKRYFVNPYAGGPGANNDGDDYARLGGGIKRWRVTKNVNGYWTNTWMQADEAHWINSVDYDRIAARTARFDQMLGEVSPEALRAELRNQIEDARRHLRNYPASCAARARRERAFEELYDLSEREFGVTRAQIDAEHRRLEDYVLGELEYAQSKTCCWNSTTTYMYEIIMDHARDEQAQAETGGTCAAPTVFKSHTDGYARWQSFATATGRAAQWRPWSEDESCAQRDVAADTAAEGAGTDFCALGTPEGEGGCTDAFEPNDSAAQATTVGAGTYPSLSICEGDVDWFVVPAGGTVTITFRHADGDLDLAAYDGNGARTAVSQGVTDSETLTVAPGAYLKVYGYNGATGPYTLTVQ